MQAKTAFVIAEGVVAAVLSHLAITTVLLIGDGLAGRAYSSPLRCSGRSCSKVPRTAVRSRLAEPPCSPLPACT